MRSISGDYSLCCFLMCSSLRGNDGISVLTNLVILNLFQDPFTHWHGIADKPMDAETSSA